MGNTKRTRDILLRSTHLEIDDIVSKLRSLRNASLESRQRHDNPPKLPSRKLLAHVAEGLGAALFPNRLGSSELADEGIDHYVGHTLNMTLRELLVQIQNELHYNSGLEVLSNEDREQSVAIARAFASNPKILFADEPTGNLDEENGKLIIKLLFDLNQSQGTTLVMVTHDNELAKMCDRQLVMSAGQLTEKSL